MRGSGRECLEAKAEGDLDDESVPAVVAGGEVSAECGGGRGSELAVGERGEVDAGGTHGFLRARMG